MGSPRVASIEAYASMLVEMMKVQAMLVKQGKDSAMPHLIAIVKELEELFGFKFEVLEGQDGQDQPGG